MARTSMVLAVTAALLSGCSALVSRPQRLPSGRMHCPNYFPPGFDSIVAAIGAGLIIWSATDRDSGETDAHTMTNREFAAVPGVLMVLPFGISAAYGYGKASSCTSEK